MACRVTCHHVTCHHVTCHHITCHRTTRHHAAEHALAMAGHQREGKSEIGLQQTILPISWHTCKKTTQSFTVCLSPQCVCHHIVSATPVCLSPQCVYHSVSVTNHTKDELNLANQPIWHGWQQMKMCSRKELLSWMQWMNLVSLPWTWMMTGTLCMATMTRQVIMTGQLFRPTIACYAASIITCHSSAKACACMNAHAAA